MTTKKQVTKTATKKPAAMTKKTTTTKKPAPAAVPTTATGAAITGCHVENKAAPVSPEAAAALAELARASAAHAQASSAHANAMMSIANALKGAEAHMTHGIYIAPSTGLALNRK